MFEEKLPVGIPVSYEWYLFDVCPFCKKYRKFNWNLLTKSGHCWSCKRGIWGYDWLQKVADCQDIDGVPHGSKKVYKGLQKATLVNAWDSKLGQEFLMSRGVSEAIARKAEVMYIPSQKALCMEVDPVIPDKPKGYIYRLLPHGFWAVASGLNGHYGWNQEICLRRRTVLVTEGVFDLMSTGLQDIGMAMLGSSPSQDWFRFWRKHNNRIVLWLDEDLAGRKATKKFIDSCLYYGIPCDIIYSQRPPKKYLAINPLNKPFLQRIRNMVNNESDFNYSRYTFTP